MENTNSMLGLYRGYIVPKPLTLNPKMETTIAYWGCIGGI